MMISPKNFVDIAKKYQFSNYVCIPCSFLTPLINYVCQDNKSRYLSCVNEGDAVATASGLTIGGSRSIVMMQNSGLGNAISPLSSLNYVFEIPVLLMITHRGAPGIDDEPQHSLCGEITTTLLKDLCIPWEYLSLEEDQINESFKVATSYMLSKERPYAFITSKDTFKSHDSKTKKYKQNKTKNNNLYFYYYTKRLPLRREILNKILKHTRVDNSVLIATTGYTGRELYQLKDRENQLYMVGSMGCVTSLGLGLALSLTDRKIVVIDGDGSALMRMGNLSTIGAYKPNNLVHILLDNEVYESTGGQQTVSSTTEFGQIAKACGYVSIYEGDDPILIDILFNDLEHTQGPWFVSIKIKPGTIEKLPRPSLTPKEILRRMMKQVATNF